MKKNLLSAVIGALLVTAFLVVLDAVLSHLQDVKYYVILTVVNAVVFTLIDYFKDKGRMSGKGGKGGK